MVRQSRGKSERCDWFFLGRDFVIRTVSVETVISRVYFFRFRKPADSKFAAETSAI